MVDLLQTLLQTIQIDLAFFVSIQCFPEFGDPLITLIFRLAGCHIQLSGIQQHSFFSKEALELELLQWEEGRVQEIPATTGRRGGQEQYWTKHRNES